MYNNSLKNKEKIFAVAPMMDWTDRHCRFFHRLLTKRATLYTEMITAQAVIFGNRDHLLAFSDEEHPVALQLGGGDPKKLADATRIASQYGFDEINLNVGCPSDRVRSGAFGACLMKTPERVGECIAAMKSATSLPVTLKCRIGVDDQDEEKALDALANAVVAAGCDGLTVHARKAWLKGLSPKNNRLLPPLNYERVYRLKCAYPGLFIAINGGIKTLDEALDHLKICDGVMMGRTAYQTPRVLSDVDCRLYGERFASPSCFQVVRDMRPYIERECAKGTRLHSITRHMLGLFHGMPGARIWRHTLSLEASLPGAGAEVLDKALFNVKKAHDKHCLADIT